MALNSLDFKGKKVVIMGLGLYEQGSGISAAKFFIRQGAKVLITDLKSAEQLKGQIKKLVQEIKKFPAAEVAYVLGKHDADSFRNADLIIRNPGVPLFSPFLKVAARNKIPVFTDISLFLKMFSGLTFGITGTRGKSTTATLLYNIVKAQNRQTILGGNITRSPLLELEKLNKNKAPVVLELSSWQTESLVEIKKSPQIAIVTNIYPDHLNTYKNLAEYVAAKEYIWRYQHKRDILVLNLDNAFTKKMARPAKARIFWISVKPFKNKNGGYIKNGKLFFINNGVEQKICSTRQLKILGEHNVYNILAAATAALAAGIPLAIVKKEILKFKGIADRLELIKRKRGVSFYNDTTSTTPQATLAALRTLRARQKKIILIAGGADKGLDFKEVGKEISKTVKQLILLPGRGTEKIRAAVKIKAFLAADLHTAVKAAWLEAKSGDIILLSPACASFGLFANEFARGKEFKKIVKKITS